MLIPSIVNGAYGTKQEIIDIYNGQTVRMIDNETGEIRYEGKGTSEIDGYSLVNVEVKDGVVVMYMSKLANRKAWRNQINELETEV